MEEKFNEATPQRPEDHMLDSSLLTIDIASFIEQIKNEPTWRDSDRNAITVFKTDGMRIVLIALHQGAEMIKHTADGVISVQVLEGNIRFTTDHNSVDLGKGQIATLHSNIPHSVNAIEESIFLLTLAIKVT